MRKNITVSLAAVIGAVMLIVLLATAAAATSVHAGEAENADTVTVSGSHTLFITPDKAELHFGVTTTEKTAKKAQEKNTEQVDRIIGSLKEIGIKEKSIATNGFNIYPNYNYSDESGKEKIDGYTASTSLTVKDVQIDDAGRTISEAVAAGVTEVQYISYTCSNYDEEYENALTGAVEAARKKAEVLAKAEGRTVGSVSNITEGWQDTNARYTNDYKLASSEMEETAAGADMGVTLMPQDSEITANVTVTYYLK